MTTPRKPKARAKKAARREPRAVARLRRDLETAQAQLVEASRRAQLFESQLERERPQLIAVQQANDALTERLVRIGAANVLNESPRPTHQPPRAPGYGDATVRELAQQWVGRAEGGAQQHHLVGLAWKLVRRILR